MEASRPTKCGKRLHLILSPPGAPILVVDPVHGEGLLVPAPRDRRQPIPLFRKKSVACGVGIERERGRARNPPIWKRPAPVQPVRGRAGTGKTTPSAEDCGQNDLAERSSLRRNTLRRAHPTVNPGAGPAAPQPSPSTRPDSSGSGGEAVAASHRRRLSPWPDLSYTEMMFTLRSKT